MQYQITSWITDLKEHLRQAQVWPLSQLHRGLVQSLTMSSKNRNQLAAIAITGGGVFSVERRFADCSVTFGVLSLMLHNDEDPGAAKGKANWAE